MVQQLRAASDNHQQIVEVMRNSTGEPADGFHLLRLLKLLLQQALLGNVLNENFITRASVAGWFNLPPFEAHSNHVPLLVPPFPLWLGKWTLCVKLTKNVPPIFGIE